MSIVRLFCFFVLTLIGTASSLWAQCNNQWHNQIDPLFNSGGEIRTSVVWDPDNAGPIQPVLVVAGSFPHIDGILVNNIAAWDGQGWQALGSGVTGYAGHFPGTPTTIFALTVFQNSLIAAGNFSTAGGTPASFVARWDGISWHPLGAGLAVNTSGFLAANGGQVSSLKVLNGQLLAGGSFNRSGSSAVLHVARWNGASWVQHGVFPGITSFDVNVLAMEELAGVLVVSARGGVQRLNPTTNQFQYLGPSPLGAGSTWYQPNDILNFNGTLWITGTFSAIGSTTVNRVAWWNGSAWQPAGSGLQYTANGGNVAWGQDLYVHNGQLHVAGWFSKSGQLFPNNIARWNGTNWQPLGSGTSGIIYTMASFHGDLVIGRERLVRMASWGCGGPTFLDPNPLVNGSNRIDSATSSAPDQVIDWSTTAMSGAQKFVTKAAADGVTRVLVRWRVTGTTPVTFSLQDESGGVSGVGAIGAPGQPPSNTSVTVNTVLVGNRRYAFAEYLVPTNFVRTSSDETLEYRPVRITGAIGATNVSVTLKLVRPPILLVHGFYSEAATWDLNIQQDSRFVVFPAQYRATNTSSFFDNRQVVLNGARSALSVTRSQGIAASQVTVIGHSMGGLLARIHGSNVYGMYRRRGNLGQGDFYKYISVYTPHEGSGVACIADRLYANPLTRAAIDWKGICVTCGAVGDLRPDSAAISSLPAMPNIASHAVVGIGGVPVLSLGFTAFETLGKRYAVASLAAHIISYLQLTANDAFASFDHDLFVGDISARGALLSNQLSYLSFLHFFFGSVHNGATTSNLINDYVLVGLLNERLPSPRFANGLAANTSYPNPPACNPSYQLPAIQLESPITGRRVRLRLPRSGITATPGSRLKIDLESSGGFQVQALDFEVEGMGGIVTDKNYVSFAIPDDAVGTYSLKARAIDPQNKVAIAPPVTLTVTSSAVLQSIEALTPWVEIGSASSLYQLTVFGHFNTGIRRDVSRASSGTVYASSNPLIVSVGPDGMLTAIAAGTAEITITHGGFTTAVTAVVNG